MQKTGSQGKVFPGKTALEILLALRDKGGGYVKIEKLYKEDIGKIDTLAELHLCKGINDVEKAVEIVLNEKVDINIPGKSNRTPLMWASTSASGEFMNTLIDLGADVNAQRTDDKVAPLHLTVYGNNYMATDILLMKGANVDTQEVDGGTPLYDAVSNNHEHLVRRLLVDKADVNIKYKENAKERIYLVRGMDKGKQAWHYVLVEKALLPLFLRRTNGGSLDVADFGLVLTSGWGKDPPEEVRKNITEMSDTFPDTQSRTVLHVASKSARLEIVDLLVKYKADINASDMDGFTPLHLAAMYGNIQVVKKLVESNADVNLKVDGKDAADLARMNKETEIEEYLKPKRSLPQRDSESQLAQSQLAESQSAESQSTESQPAKIQPAGSQSLLKAAIKGAGQGLKYLEHGLKLLDENFS